MAQINEEFRNRMLAILPNEADRLCQALFSTEPEVSVRLNRRKTRTQPNNAQQVAWCDCGYYLDGRPAFTFDPLLHTGAYYVQDASSMFIHRVLSQLVGDRDVTYLDLCAAPGGKTTTALGALSDGSLVVCNEIDGTRAQILRENVIKWGCPNCVVTNDNATRLGKLRNVFDVVAADMPCSGEGMFRKDEEAVSQWSPELVRQCAERQREIAADIWNALKPGGIFIYSTCTFNREENEEMADYIIRELGAESVEIATDPSWHIQPGIDTPHHCYRFMPHHTRGEGLFMCVLRKDGEMPASKPDKGKKQKKEKRAAIPAVCKNWLTATDCDWQTDGESISALPSRHSETMHLVARNASTLLCGVPVASVKGKDTIPDHALSQSLLFNTEAFPCVEVSYPEAIAFLRGETFALPDGLPRGYVCICYAQRPLGFMKNIGNRANNCYPKEWRIRSSFAPAEIPTVIPAD